MVDSCHYIFGKTNRMYSTKDELWTLGGNGVPVLVQTVTNIPLLCGTALVEEAVLSGVYTQLGL